MKDIQIVSTGGTFNKIYNPLNGNLEIDTNNLALKKIQNKWLCQFNIDAIINKDSLDFTNQDREELTNYIQKSEFNKIIIIHGTDTMDLSAQYLASQNLNKTIIFTGAMVPFSIDPIEATANLTLAIGYLKCTKNGVYIAMNGVVDSYDKVKKDRVNGKFVSNVC